VIVIFKVSKKILPILNIISFTGVIIINALANILPLNGYTTGEVAAKFPNLFTPAPITFSIWGVIYFLLALFIVYQAKGLVASKNTNEKVLEQINYLFILSSLANIGWIFAWHYLRIKLSFLVMLVLLFPLVLIYKRLKIGKEQVTKGEKYFVHLPFSVYLGWITVATLANLTVLLVDLNLYRSLIPAVPWTVGLIMIATVLGSYIYLKRKDIYYSLVIIWSLIGIIVKRIFIAQELVISVAVTAGIGVLVILMIIFISSQVIKRRNKF
jgi:hypothetical protein